MHWKAEWHSLHWSRISTRVNSTLNIRVARLGSISNQNSRFLKWCENEGSKSSVRTLSRILRFKIVYFKNFPYFSRHSVQEGKFNICSLLKLEENFQSHKYQYSVMHEWIRMYEENMLALERTTKRCERTKKAPDYSSLFQRTACQKNCSRM